MWGRQADPSWPFYSGSGSHNTAIVTTYVSAMQDFLAKFDHKPTVVDLGCGDFFVGSKIRQYCDSYIACDIVPELIDFNRRHYGADNVEFKVLDVTTNELPQADVACIRQVLQHLSNDQIMRVIPKIMSRYKYLIVTEHLPGTDEFEPNIDMPAGPNIRLGIGSGIVLTSPPFNLQPISESVLCQSCEQGGIITTTLYQLSG